VSAVLNPKYPDHIVITGGSSGIGAALALQYAGPGVYLSLAGRNEQRLQEVAAACHAKGAHVDIKIIDVTNAAAMREWLEACDTKTPITLLIANAGISAGTQGALTAEDPAQVRLVFDVNLIGVLNTVDPVLPLMQARGRGAIALMSSLAGFRGWPGAPAYCASKAGVKVYGEALRGALAATGVRVHVICPGFVESRMTAVNDFPMPFLMTAERAAKIIAKGIYKNQGRIAFPFWPHAMAWFISILPDAFTHRLLLKTPRKKPVNTDS
jgi:short-subunit dehydrogenase